jgi:hypothetical protein
MRMQCECNVNGMPAMPEMSEMFDMPEAQVVEECRSSKDRRLESRQEQCAQCATYQDVPRRTTTYHDEYDECNQDSRFVLISFFFLCSTGHGTTVFELPCW